MHRNTIAAIWLVGILVAVLAYAIDPGALLDVALNVINLSTAALERLLYELSALGSDIVRALAVGLFVTFLALALLAIRQGHKGLTALLVVSTAFVWLVRGGGASNGRWVAAFALAAVAALVMTNRVRRGAP